MRRESGRERGEGPAAPGAAADARTAAPLALRRVVDESLPPGWGPAARVERTQAGTLLVVRRDPSGGDHEL